jgi:predicted nuclease of predicted toxin-antitoxin system
MRFVADVNVSRRVVERLRALGCDIVRVPEIMDARSSDQEVLGEAQRRGAVLISHDQDFGAALAISGALAPSFINLRTSGIEPKELAQTILAVVHATEEDLVAGAVVTVDDAGARVHRLPLV